MFELAVKTWSKMYNVDLHYGQNGAFHYGQNDVPYQMRGTHSHGLITGATLHDKNDASKKVTTQYSRQ